LVRLLMPVLLHRTESKRGPCAAWLLHRHADEGRPGGTPFFSERERAVLAWAEALTHIGNGVPDDLYAEARKEFSEKELVDLTWAVAAINVWNRVSISMRAVPGSYQPKGHHA
jgi:hypothetical protein